MLVPDTGVAKPSPANDRAGSAVPPGYQALIANSGAPNRNDWKIMRIDDDAQEDWNGHYESAEAALAVLQKEFE